MKDVMTGRVDLVRALTSGGSVLQDAVADLLGFERAEKPPPPREEREHKPIGLPGAPVLEGAPVPMPFDVPFWQVQDFVAREPRSEDEPPPVDSAPPKKEPVPLPPAALASGAAILTQLRRYSAFSDLSGGVDIDRTISRLSKGYWLRHFPRRPRKRWGQAIHVIGDRSRRLAPFWLDQDYAISQLKRVYPRHGFQLAIIDDGAAVPRTLLPPGPATPYRLPDPGTVVLVLGDLGCLSRQGEEREWLAQIWLEWGRRLRANGNPALALVPCHPSHCRGALSRLWTVLPWEGVKAQERPALSDAELESAAEQVITRLAFALRVEPQLVRVVRHMLPAGSLDAGIESYVWQHGAFQSRHHEAATFDPASMRSLLPEFFRLPEAERKRVYDVVRQLRWDVYPGVWFSELLALERDVARGLLERHELRQADWWLQRRLGDLKATGAANDPAANEPTWFRRVFARLPESVRQGSASRTLHAIWDVVRPDEEVKNLPDFLDPALLPPSSNAESTIALKQVGDRLVAQPFPGDERGGSRRAAKEDEQPPGSLLGLIRTRNGLIRIERLDEFWDGGVPPTWAQAWGRDDYGAWVTFRVGEVVQRMRWIPAGRFWMGSPDNEPGRYDDENPRHEEVIPRGFWMFDTPCTQALWEVVMEKNPSYFRSPDRPVEQVTWNDCQEFIQRLNARLGGLSLALPTEAQWEYACRAGTETATYAGPIEIKGLCNAPILHEIAWYGGNSGLDFDLDTGVAASDWPEKQFEFAQAGTDPVGRKRANAWGLYDMLGNVWEWCADTWTDDYTTGSRAAAQQSASAPRVIRGGSWTSLARDVRAACRIDNGPTFRNDDLGVRFCEFGEPSVVSQAGKEAARGAGGGAPEDRDETSGAERFLSVDSSAPGVLLAALAPLSASSDVERIVLRPIVLPAWASAIGRDRYGLWAEFTVDPAPPKKSRGRGKTRMRQPHAQSPVGQRLRWIPPGRFLMGSPRDEPGRYDWEQEPHEVTIAEGFWMFDTPCTQALWQAVMGDNPSRFRSPDRPVERVSWNDCQEFLKQINANLTEKAGESNPLRLALPTEAEWEYACRAGTETATYAGPMEIKGGNNAPILHEIAWYGGNSGLDFDLKDGEPASGWPEKQFEFGTAGTHPVGLKRANAWGLYDMLGNVWEWCASLWEGSEEVGASAHRVIRGGSWGNDARDVRAAYRYDFEPTNRSSNLGVRLCEFREPSVVSSAGERSRGAEAGRGASRSGAEPPPPEPQQSGEARGGRRRKR
jgi:formylglycine-generating enzyme required for sulfatase activity